MMVGDRMQGKWLSTPSCCVFALERLTVTLLQQQPKHPQICQPAANNKQSSSSNPKRISSAYCPSSARGLRSTQLHQGVNTRYESWCCSALVSRLPSSSQGNPQPVYKANSLHKLSSVMNVAQRFPRKNNTYVGKAEISTGKT